MFIPWSFLAINVVLALFQFSMVDTVSYLLSIYSRFGDEYANSIRWVRQGGYYEMYKTLVNSRRSISNSTKSIFISITLLSITASIVDVGALYFVTPAGELESDGTVCITTDQFSPFDTVTTFDGWSKFVRVGSNITEAMILMINDPNRIPNPLPGKIYDPQLTEYEVGCNKLKFNTMIVSGNTTALSQDGCATLTHTKIGAFQLKGPGSKVTKKSNNQYSISQQVTDLIDFMVELPSQLQLDYDNTTCQLSEVFGSNFINATLKSQYTSFPTTYVTKCVLSPDYKIITLSLTQIKFAANSTNGLTSLIPILKSNTLGSAMIKSLNKIKANETIPTLYSEVLLGDTNFEELTCRPWFAKALEPPSKFYITCSYSIMSTIITTPQPLNVQIHEARENMPPELASQPAVIMTIQHAPNLTESGIRQLSFPEAIEITSDTAQFFARLGQNFDTAWSQSKLHIVYEISYILAGFEVPLWLCIILPTMTLLCAGFCLLTHYLLDPVYTGSLYKVMSSQLAPRSKSFTPMIRWSKVYSMDGEGFRAAPGDSRYFDVDQKPDTKIAKMKQAWIAS